MDNHTVGHGVVHDPEVTGDNSTEPGGGTGRNTGTITVSAHVSGFQQKPETWQRSEDGQELSAEIRGYAQRGVAGTGREDLSLPVAGRVILRLGSAPATRGGPIIGLPQLTPTVGGALRCVRDSAEMLVGLFRFAAVELIKVLANPSDLPTHPISEVEIQLTVGSDELELYPDSEGS